MSKFNKTSVLLLSALALSACSKFNLAPAPVESNQDADERVIYERDSMNRTDTRCADARFVSPRDQQQTLGYLKPGYVMPEGGAAQDCEDHHKKHHKKHHAKKHHAPAKKKAAEPKVDAYKKHVEPAAPKEMTPAVQQPVAQPAPIAPATQPAVTPTAPATAPAQPATTPQKSAMPMDSQTPPAKLPSAAPATQAPVSAQPETAPVQAPSVAPTAPSAPVAPVAPTAPTKPMSSEQTPADTAQPQTQAALPNQQIVVGSVNVIDFNDAEVELPTQSIATLDRVADDWKAHTNKNIKIDSYAYLANGNSSEARRNSLQRAIKIRKYLIDKDVAANRISVNAVEDAGSRSNKVEIKLEDIRS